MSKFLILIYMFFWGFLSQNECHPVDNLKTLRRPSLDYEQWQFLEPLTETAIPFSRLNNNSFFQDESNYIQPIKTSPDKECPAARDPKTSKEVDEQEKMRSKRRKAKGKPNSIDLTFHLLREFLQVAKEERMTQKAISNKKLMQVIGK